MGQDVHKYSIKGLSCANCALKIENTLKDQNFADVQLNFATRVLTFSCGEKKCDSHSKEINAIISKIEPGAQAFPEITMDQPQDRNWIAIVRITVSLLLLGLGIVLTNPSMTEQVILTGYMSFFLAYFIAGWKVLKNAILQLRNYDFTNEYILMSVATIGAIIIQEIPEAVAVMVFYTIGEYLQTKAINHSRQSIGSLLDIRPDQAHLVVADSITTVPIAEVKPDDIILVKPGERIPLDGKIVKGHSNLDMTTLTGESRPVVVKEDDEVLSGSITSSSIHIQVTSPCYDSTVSRILNAVENAAKNKSKTELFITRFARYYTPLVLLLALFIAIIPPLLFRQAFDVWVYRAFVILVISCPCALVVSIPLVYFSGIGKSSREGILLKGANVIDSLNEVSTVLWDKTGTLTVGKFKVITIVPIPDYSPHDILAYAALAEAHSTHPIAASIREAYGKQVDLTQIEEYEELPALGIMMKTKSNESIVVGNDKLTHKVNCPHSECIRDETAVYVIRNGEYIGHIIIDDQIKTSSYEAVKRLKSQGILNIGLLTGDSKNVAERVGKELGIDQSEIYANLMPLNKLEILERYIYKKNGVGAVIFVGDGINDAPVIARADIGVAMGGIGSDATIEAADLVIMEDNPSKLSDAIDIAKKTNRLAKQNIVLALGIKAIFILLGAMGLATMWAAVFGDVGVTILTVLNSLRLLR
ncbi:MAG: cadmium-translocating P-type ATPase [Candidatus Heimdallarchaeota archaeon]|nr:MAG: cadmium-translocating P-type ATPase [Candidatus Heimdallarchaeota archaeon]